MEEYVPNIGDRVFIRKIDSSHWSPSGNMDKWIGTIQKITELSLDNRGIHVTFDTEGLEDKSINEWFWRPNIHFEPARKKVVKIKFKPV